MVATRLLLRPPPSLFISSSTPQFLFAATVNLSIRRRSFSVDALLSGNLSKRSPSVYGPSLLKGSRVKRNPEIVDSGFEDDGGVIDEEGFTRVFDVSAIRVPAKDCFLLEERLRGHLLNWPRIRNIARVPGDDVEEGFSGLAAGEEEKMSLDSLDRRVYGRADGDGERLSSVLYRDKLVKSFDANGFVNFKNVAKMSRPGRRKKLAVVEGEDAGVTNGVYQVDEKVKRLGKGNRNGRNGFAMVEVVEDDQAGNWSGLLGDGFCGGVRWKGPTRLLLLDESYANKDVDQLPGAIKVSAKLF